MIRVDWEWFGDALIAELSSKLEANSQNAGETLADLIYRRISTPYPPSSAPGSAPHMRTGRLRESYGAATRVEGGNIVTYVGSDVFYSIDLELGRADPPLAPRPHIVSTLMQYTYVDWLGNMILNVS